MLARNLAPISVFGAQPVPSRGEKDLPSQSHSSCEVPGGAFWARGHRGPLSSHQCLQKLRNHPRVLVVSPSIGQMLGGHRIHGSQRCLQRLLRFRCHSLPSAIHLYHCGHEHGSGSDGAFWRRIGMPTTGCLQERLGWSGRGKASPGHGSVFESI